MQATLRGEVVEAEGVIGMELSNSHILVTGANGFIGK